MTGNPSSGIRWIAGFARIRSAPVVKSKVLQTFAVSALCARVVCAEPDPWRWQGEWQPTGLLGCYHSYVAMSDGRLACFQNMGVTTAGESATATELVVSFTREPGAFIDWTDPVALLTWDQIDDLFEERDAKTLAHNRLLTRPAVTRLADGGYFGIGVVCRGYFPKDGLRWIARFRGSAASVDAALRQALDGAAGTVERRWDYLGKCRGPVGDYLEREQQPYALSTDLGPLLYDAGAPAAPDHAHPAANRFVAFPNHLGAPGGGPSGGRTALVYSADGEAWHFAKEPDGAIRDLTPFHGDARRCFPFVIRQDGANWWMWQADGWYPQAEGELPSACRGVYLYQSSDALTWRQVRRDVDCRSFRRADGTIPGLKNLSAWYDPSTDVLHGFVSVWEENPGRWRKYHNTSVLDATRGAGSAPAPRTPSPLPLERRDR